MDKHRCSFLMHSPGTVFFFFSLTFKEVIFTDFKIRGDIFLLFLFYKGSFLFEIKNYF